MTKQKFDSHFLKTASSNFKRPSHEAEAVPTPQAPPATARNVLFSKPPLPPQGFPTLSIRLEQLTQNTTNKAYRLSIEQTHLLNPNTPIVDFKWQQEFLSGHGVSLDHPIKHPWMRYLTLHLSDGQLTVQSLSVPSKTTPFRTYQGYNYLFQVVADLHLKNFFTDGQIKVQRARNIFAQGEVYGQEGIFFRADKDINTRAIDPKKPTLVHSKGQIFLKSSYLDNENSRILAPIIQGKLGRKGQRGPSLDNTRGTIEATTHLLLDAQTEIFNELGILQSPAGKTNISTQESFFNKDGFAGGKQQFDLFAQRSLQNTKGQLGSDGIATVTAEGWRNTNGAHVWGQNLKGQSLFVKTDETSHFAVQETLNLATHLFYQESPLLARTIDVHTTLGLDIARSQATSLSLSTDRGSIVYKPLGLRAHKLLSLTSKEIPLVLKIPLKSPGAFAATAPRIFNKTTVAIKDQITLNGTSTDASYPVRNEGVLISATKGLTVNGNGFRHTKGHLHVAGDATFPRALKLKSKTYIGGNAHIYENTGYIDYNSLSVQGLLHLTFPDHQRAFFSPIRIPGQLEIDREDGFSYPFLIGNDLIAKKGIKLNFPHAPLILGSTHAGIFGFSKKDGPAVKIQADNGFLKIQSKSLDVVKAQLFSRTGMHFEVQEKQIHIGRGIVSNVEQTFTYLGVPYGLINPYGYMNITETCSYPFKQSNGTALVTEGPVTMFSLDGVLVDQAEIQLLGKGNWDVTTRAPVRNEGGNISIHGNVNIHSPAESPYSETLLQNIFQTQTVPCGGRCGSCGYSQTQPFSNPGRMTINGNLTVDILEDMGKFTHVGGKFLGKKINAVSFSTTVLGGIAEYSYWPKPSVVEEKFLPTLSAKSVRLIGGKDPKLEGLIQTPVFLMTFEGKAMVGKMANYQRLATPPFQPMKRFMDVHRSSVLFQPALYPSTPWINQPTVSLTWNVPLPPAVGLGSHGLYLLSECDKLLLHPLEEIGDLPHVLGEQVKRGYLDEEHPEALATYIMGRRQAYDLYLRFFAPKSLEGTRQNPTPATEPEKALGTLGSTLAKTMTEEEMSKIKFMMLYYGMAYEGRTVHLPLSWVSKSYDDPKVRNPDGGVFANIVLFKGETPDSVLHCVSTIHGENLVAVNVAKTILERQNHTFLTYHMNTTTKKGSWWRGDSEESQTVAILNSQAQTNTGNMSTGKEGQMAIKGDFALENGASLDIGSKGLALDLKEFRASPSVNISSVQSTSSAGGTSITSHPPVYDIQPPTITSSGGVGGTIKTPTAQSLKVVATDKDINLQVQNDAKLLACQRENCSGPTVSKEGKSVVVKEIYQPIAVPCAFLALNGKVFLTVGGKLQAEAPQFFGKVISLDASEHDITSLLMANKFFMTSKTEGMFSAQATSMMQESPSMLSAIFEGDEIHIRGIKGKIEGALFKGKSLHDHTIEGLILAPLVRMFLYNQQTTSKGPLASSDVGLKGGYEAMLPTVLLVDKVVREIEGNQINLDSVQWDKNRTEIIGNFAETTYQLKQWQTSWAHHEQLIPNEALVVVALAVGLATQGWGASLINSLSSTLFGTVNVAATATAAATIAPAIKLSALGVAVANAGISAVCSSIATSGLRTGDLAQVGKDLTSASFVKSLSISMLSAGLCQHIGDVFGIDMNPTLTELANPDKQVTFMNFLQANALKTMVETPLNCLIGQQSVDEAVKCGLKNLGVNTVASYFAYHIGKIYGQNKMSYLEHKGLHGGLGAAAGWLLNPTQKGLISGAIGGIVSEVVIDERREIAKEKAMSIMAEAEKEGIPLNAIEFKRKFYESLSGELAFAKLSGATVAALLGQDPSVAFQTGTNAVENNAIMLAVGVGLASYEVYQIIKTWREEGPKAALQKVAVDGTIMLVTAGAGKVVYDVAKLSAPMAEMVWMSYLAQNPVFAQVASKVFAPLGKGFANAKGLYQKADEVLEKGANKLYHKMFGRKSSSTTVERLDLAGGKTYQSSYWNRTDTHTFRGQTNKVYKRDDLIDIYEIDTQTGLTNQALMLKGKAPKGPDGKSINLHHSIQTPGGPLVEVTSTFHDLNSKILHINSKSTPSGINRIEFKRWREEYWKTRVKELE